MKSHILLACISHLIYIWRLTTLSGSRLTIYSLFIHHLLDNRLSYTAENCHITKNPYSQIWGHKRSHGQ